MDFPDLPIFEIYPPVPQKPDILRKKIEDLTPEQCKIAIDAKIQYDQEYSKYKEQLALVRHNNVIKESKYIEQCWKCIKDENGISESEENHPLVKWIANKAWEDGHAHGMGEVAIHFSDLMEAYNIHLRLMNELRSQFKK